MCSIHAMTLKMRHWCQYFTFYNCLNQRSVTELLDVACNGDFLLPFYQKRKSPKGDNDVWFTCQLWCQLPDYLSVKEIDSHTFRINAIRSA